MGSLPDLTRRLSRKIEQGKAIQLAVDDLDLLVETGAFALLLAKAADFQRKQCQHRSARSRSIGAVPTASIGATVGQTSKSSGMTPSESASEALAQVQRMLGKAS